MTGSGGQRKNPVNALVITLNVALVFCLVLAFLTYDRDYQQKLYTQNVEDISNVNQASAAIASTFFSGREAKLRDLALYIEGNGLTLTESMDYIYSSNSDEAKSFEIIGPDYTGYCIERDADGVYLPLDYRSGYGDICKIFAENALQKDSQVIGFAPEFTDAHTAMTSFALYTSLHLPDETGTLVPYTLMVVSRSSDFISYINIDSGYDILSTAIISRSGAYIIGGSAFKSTGFFKFLADFNDLTLDEQNAIQSKVLSSQKGELAYNDARGRRSVFVYTPVAGQNWFCVTSVPVASFHNSDIEFSFSVMVVVVMLLLLATDLLYLSALNRRLRKSAENERIAGAAKADFLSRMSHDMRTPMNGIIGMTRLTRDIPGLPDEAQENLAAIADSGTYLLQLINDTLDMSKIESNKVTLNPEVLAADALVRHILSGVGPLADQKQIHLECTPAQMQPIYIRGDRTRLQQIFTNILSNAVKFTPEGGTIRVDLSCQGTENGISHDCITIEDTGCGMSEEFLKHIFEPFTQEKTRIVNGQEGTGLGMSIVKNLVTLMGGRVEINSKLGEGTKVAVYLDLEHLTDVPAEGRKNQSVKTAQLDGKRVLLAEDHPLNATIAKRLLQKRGVLVEHAENGAVALRMFTDSAPRYYDAILMDIRMPEMDGLEATRRIRALPREDAKTVPILAMTANAYVEDVQAALAAGMNAHLAKPIEPEILYEALAEHMGRAPCGTHIKEM